MIIKYQLYIYKLFEKVYELIFDRYPFNIDSLFIIDFSLFSINNNNNKKKKRIKIWKKFRMFLADRC